MPLLSRLSSMLNPSKPLYVVAEDADVISPVSDAPSSSQASCSSSLSSPGILKRSTDPHMPPPPGREGARAASVSFADDLGIVADDGPTQEDAPMRPHDGGGGVSGTASPLSSAAASPRTGLLSGRGGFRTSKLAGRFRGAFSPAVRKRPPPEPVSVSAEENAGCSEAEETPTPKEHAGDDGFSFDEDLFKTKSGQLSTGCWSKKDIVTKRNSVLPLTILVLSVFSTVMSGVWLVVAVVQPRWGHTISSRGGLLPSTATTLTALLSKTIEMSFVTVFISCVGQVLTRRAIVRRSQGMTLAEMTMRNWVLQPGSLVTHWDTLPSAGATVLGALSLTAAVVSMLYITASEAMVAPKLKHGGWRPCELAGRVRAPYSNSFYVEKICPTLLAVDDWDEGPRSCLNVEFSGQSYRDLLAFMTTWKALQNNGSVPAGSGAEAGSGAGAGAGAGAGDALARRPAGTSLLHGNTTMAAAWIEREHANVTRQSAQHGRIVNNVTMAMPHPGVYAAATSPANGILQPDDLDGVGQYAIRAGVASPAIGVLCVNMSPRELAPLVYTEWPQSRKENKTVNGRNWLRAVDGWETDVPRYSESGGYLNRTVVDDVFRWGPKYQRRPPVFERYPSDYNLVANSTGYKADAVYLVGKSPKMDNYTVCEMRSWLSPNCSTHFNVSGTSGATMRAHCEDANDGNAYHLSVESDQGWDGRWPGSSVDWKLMAHQWRLFMDLNGGTNDNNASNARILTQLALSQDRLQASFPSMAEALAVYGGSTLVLGAIDTPFRHYWAFDAPQNILGEPGVRQRFNASIVTQEYTSGHVKPWQAVFYPVLVLVFAINLCCLAFLCMSPDVVTDLTEPQNLFALAINSPPSDQLNGSCGGGPRHRDLVVPWRVAFAREFNHYFFVEAGKRPLRGRFSAQDAPTADECVSEVGSRYKRLSSGRGWP